MAGERNLANGDAPKGAARLEKAVGELKGVAAVFPAANAMIEGLRGAKEAAVEEVKRDLDGIRGKATGLEDLARDIRDKASKMESHASSVQTAENQLLEVSRGLDEKATGAQTSAAASAAAAKEVSDALSSLKITFKGTELAGVAALAKIGELASMFPAMVKAEVSRVVSAEVGEGDSKRELFGVELIAHVVLGVDGAERAAGRALAAAEHVEEIMTQGGELVNAANDASLKAESAAIEAKGAAKAAEKTAESLSEKLDEAGKQLRTMYGVLMAVLKNNGLNTEVTEDMVEEASAAAEGAAARVEGEDDE